MLRAVNLFKRYPIVVILPILLVGGMVFRQYLPGAAADLQVGDCFDEPAELRSGVGPVEISDVQHRPCNELHDGEVFFVFDYAAPADGAYPRSDSFDDAVADRCLPGFASYTGAAFEDRLDLDLRFFSPSPGSWAEGDRELTCYLVSADEKKLSTSHRTVQ